jgi:predicted esterase
MKRHTLTVEKTARYFLLGTPGVHIKHVVFVCHGYAQLASEFLASFECIARDTFLVVAPEGLHRFYARGTTDRVVASWMTKEDRADDIHDYVGFLDKTYKTVMRGLPKDVKITVLGFSQGAATVSRWAALGNSRIGELILYCGFFPPDLPPAGIPESIGLTVVTASDDKYISEEQEKFQLAAMRKTMPRLNHLRYTGQHEIDADILHRLFPGLRSHYGES